MKILLGLDDQPYSEFAVKQTAKLAVNTYADVTLLASVQHRPQAALKFLDLTTRSALGYSPFPEQAEMLRRYWKVFIDHCPPESPYFDESVQFQLVEVKEKIFEEIKLIRPRRKELKLRLRQGNAADCIVSEANEEGNDLVVIGCTKGEECVWSKRENVPKRVVNESGCSVLVIKEDRDVNLLLCCLDQENVSQESLEMINQLATIYGASLNLIGLTRENAIRYDVDNELWRIQKYFSSRGVDTFVQLMDISKLDDYLRHEAKHDLLALWMGKRSLLHRFFPRDWAGNIVHNADSSVIFLR